MKWFKHETLDRNRIEAKLIKAKFGAEGYGIYNSLLEVIGENMLEDNIKDWGHVDPMHTVGTLADECCTTGDKLKEFLNFCNEKSIFLKHDGRLFSPLILRRLDEYAEKVRSKSGVTRDKIGIKSGKKRREEKREEENRVEESKGVTPKEETKKFFEIVSIDSDEYLKFIESFSKKFSISPELANREVKKFINYWSEKTASGKKQRWETEKTFEIQRRLAKWFSNASQWSKEKIQNKTRTIANV